MTSVQGCIGREGGTLRYGIQMRVHDRYCLVPSRGAKQKSKKKALQVPPPLRGAHCARPARYFDDDFPKLSPRVYHYHMKPPSRPTAAPCLPNEATNHPCTTLNKLPLLYPPDGWDRSLGLAAMWPFWRASPPPHCAGFAHAPVHCEPRTLDGDWGSTPR